MDYSKPALPVHELIAKLEARKLTIGDKERTAKYLSLVGYYRLTGYMYHLQNADGSHQFKEGITFDQVIEPYQFDKKTTKSFFGIHRTH